jgi:RNA polymerase sigma-70 factor (ECF subfamily)
VPGPEQALEHHALRDWVWEALARLTPDERVTVMLRHFTRCTSYEAIAQTTAVRVGTVRSRLNRARSRLADALLTTIAGTPLSHADLVAGQRQTWEDFYRMLHNAPEARTYQDLFAADIDVRDTVGHWHGIAEWAAEERKAISAGVRATLVEVLAGRDITVLEIDFSNPPDWPDHCPPQATFVHRLKSGQSAQLLIHYPRRMAF